MRTTTIRLETKVVRDKQEWSTRSIMGSATGSACADFLHHRMLYLQQIDDDAVDERAGAPGAEGDGSAEHSEAAEARASSQVDARIEALVSEGKPVPPRFPCW